MFKVIRCGARTVLFQSVYCIVGEWCRCSLRASSLSACSVQERPVWPGRSESSEGIRLRIRLSNNSTGMLENNRRIRPLVRRIWQLIRWFSLKETVGTPESMDLWNRKDTMRSVGSVTPIHPLEDFVSRYVLFLKFEDIITNSYSIYSSYVYITYTTHYSS